MVKSVIKFIAPITDKRVRNALPTALAAAGVAFLAGGPGLAAVTFVLTALSGSFTKTAKGLNAQQGIKEEIRSATAPRQIVYGRAKIAGTLVFAETSGEDNKFLHMVFVVAAHETNSFEKWYVNDELVTLDGSGFVSAGKYAGKIRILTASGTSTQTGIAALESETSMAAAGDGKDLAYYHVRLEYDEEVFQNGRPRITAIVKGAELYDPRLDSTVPGGSGAHRENDPTTWAWSDNWALVIYDYLRRTPLGSRIANKWINVASIIAAANIADENVNLDGGGTQKRYTLDGVITSDRVREDAIGDMLVAGMGQLIFQTGQFHLYAGADTPANITFMEDDLRAPISVQTKRPRRDQVNRVTGRFLDSQSDLYEATNYPAVIDAAAETEDGGEVLETNVDFAMVRNGIRAQRLARIFLNAARLQMTAKMPVNLKGLQVQAWSVIKVTNATFGWTDKLFRVVGWQIGPDGGIDLTLAEYATTIYGWTPATDEEAVQVPTAPILADESQQAAKLITIEEGAINARTFVRFDGSVNGSRVEVADDPAWDFEASEAGTWEWTSRVTAIGAEQAILGKNDTSGANIGWGARIFTSGVLRVAVNDGTTQTVLDHETVLEADREYDFAFKRSAAGVITSYVDGVPSDTTITENDTLANSAALQFGARVNTVSELTGRMRNIRRWDSELTDAQIQANRSTEFDGSEAGLIGLWLMDEGSGVTTFQKGSTADGDGLFVTLGPSWGGVSGDSLADETGTNDSRSLIDSAIVPSSITMDQGDENVRPITYGSEEGEAGDGDAVTFETAWIVTPQVDFVSGGLSASAALTAPYKQRFQAVNLTTSGFTADLVLVEDVGTPTPVSDSPDAAGGGGDPDLVIQKSTATEAWDDKYTYQFDVTVQNDSEWDEEQEEFFFTPGWIDIGLYTRTGAGSWTLRATKRVHGDFAAATKAVLNVTKTITVDGQGLADASGTEFGVSVEGFLITGTNVLNNFDQVDYATATAPSEHDATNGGDEPVKYRITGGAV